MVRRRRVMSKLIVEEGSIISIIVIRVKMNEEIRRK
jgi:hypothetical protein